MLNKIITYSIILAFVVLCPLAGAQDSSTQVGRASWYGKKHHGKRTANGERFDMHALTAAHRTLPFGTRIRVLNLSNGREVVVRINDRGPYVKKRIIDLSHRAAKDIGMLRQGVARVKIEIIVEPSEALHTSRF